MDKVEILGKLGDFLLELKVNPDTTLQDEALLPVIALPFKGFEIGLLLKTEKLPFQLDYETGIQVNLFRPGQNQNDPDGIMAHLTEANPYQVENNYILKYGFTLSIDKGLEKKFSPFTIGISAGSKLRHFAYLLHQQPNEKLVSAIHKDLKRLPNAISLDSLKVMSIGTVAGFESQAQMGLTLKISKFDLVATALPLLNRLVQNGDLMGINVSRGGSFEVNMTVADSFKLWIYRLDEDSYRFGIKKSNQETLSGKLQSGIQVAFSKPAIITEEILDIRDELLASLFGQPKQLVPEVKQSIKEMAELRTPLHEAHPKLMEIIEAVIAKMGLAPVKSPILQLHQKIEAFENELEKNLLERVKSQLALNFSYTYKRIEAESSILEANLTAAALDKLHPQLLRFEVGKIWEGKLKDVEVISFLHEKRLNLIKEWKLTLGLGKFQIGFQQRSDFQEVQEQNQCRHSKWSYYRKFNYQETGMLGGNSTSWHAVWSATTPDFQPTPPWGPFSQEIQIGMQFQLKNLRQGKENFDTLLDAAQAWLLIPEYQFEAISNEIWTELEQKQAKQIAVNLLMDVKLQEVNEAWHKLLQKPERHLPMLAQALGRSMPYRKDFPIRQNISLRQTHYAKLWMDLLKAHWEQKTEVDFANFSQLAKVYFENLDPTLARYEGSYTTRSKPGENILFGGILASTPVIQPLRDFFDAAKSLMDSKHIFLENPKEFFMKESAGFEPVWKQYFLTKVIGTYLILLLTPSVVDSMRVQGHLSISFKNSLGETEQKIYQRMNGQII